mgnify:CR=1 FL=1
MPRSTTIRPSSTHSCTPAERVGPVRTGGTILGVVDVTLVGVRVEVPSNQPIMLLREAAEPRRYLPIFIGSPEATAIVYALQGMETPRPMTHDLFVLALERLGAELRHVVITHVSNGTFFAELVLGSGSGEETVVSCRPSDALALALRANAPIYARESLLDEVSSVPDDPGDSPDEILDEFKEFIENISPDDFDI